MTLPWPTYDDVKGENQKWTPADIKNMMMAGKTPTEIIEALDASNVTVYKYTKYFQERINKARERIKNGEDRFKGRKNDNDDTGAKQKDRDDDTTEAELGKDTSINQRRELRARRYAPQSSGHSPGYPSPYVRRAKPTKSEE